MINQKWKPGDTAPASGIYAPYNSQGQCGASVYLEEGESFPVTYGIKGCHYEKQD